MKGGDGRRAIGDVMTVGLLVGLSSALTYLPAGGVAADWPRSDDKRHPSAESDVGSYGNLHRPLFT